jgi:hypothetical protein
MIIVALSRHRFDNYTIILDIAFPYSGLPSYEQVAREELRSKDHQSSTPKTQII